MSGPRPPFDLATRTLRFFHLAPGAIVHRFYSSMDGTTVFDPIYYDCSLRGRFNAPDGTYGVLYAAHRPHGAFAESFLRTSGRRVVDTGLMARKGYTMLKVQRRLKMVHFDGRWLARIGATAAVAHGDPPYESAQAWSKALRGHPSAPNGIIYTARHDPGERCYALFEGPAASLAEVSRDTNLDADWFWQLADHYGVGLAP